MFDRRIAKRVDEGADATFERTERYVYDGEDIALVFDGAGSLENRYLHGPGIDEVFADENALGEILWGLGDNQGTIRDVVKYDAGTDTTSVVNHLKYDAFGKLTSQSDAAYEPRFAYIGREWDADAGMYYYRARWYDPALGRFASEDPIGFAAGDANLSRYVGNSPTNFVDPSGLASLAVNFWHDKTTGAAAGWNWFTNSYSYTFDTHNRNWQHAIQWLDGIRPIDFVILAGHGNTTGSLGNGTITLELLKDPNSNAYKFLDALGKELEPNSIIVIKACYIASKGDGLELMQRIAKITKAYVFGYTGEYAITPSGDEYVATPDGRVYKTRSFGSNCPGKW